MTQYTRNINYKQQPLTAEKGFSAEWYPRLQLNPSHPSYHDAKTVFDIERFQYPYLPLFLGEYSIVPSKESVNVLRLLIRINDAKASIFLPKELQWLKTFVNDAVNYHHQHYAINQDAFLHLTVRMGTYDELYYKEACTWHIDGFQGARDARHIPEQNILWCNVCPTRFLLQPFFVLGLQAERHNIHAFFRSGWMISMR